MVHAQSMLSIKRDADALKLLGEGTTWCTLRTSQLCPIISEHPVKGSLSNWKCRTVYSKLAHVGGQLVDALKLLGDKEPVDMSLACMCETIDALGLTGFDKPYHNIDCFKEGQPAHMLNVRSPVGLHLAATCVWS